MFLFLTMCILLCNDDLRDILQVHKSVIKSVTVLKNYKSFNK